MNDQHVFASGHLILVMLFLLLIATLVKGLVLLQCYVTLATIQTDFRIERDSIASRQNEIMTRLSSIEICIDVQSKGTHKEL